MSSSEHDCVEMGWISWFLTLKGNDFFCQVDEDYLHDNFNLTGLVSQIPYYDFALDLVTDIVNDEEFSDQNLQMIEHDAEVLYGLVHARYILTIRGLHAMLAKYRQYDFGLCPRFLCYGQALLPVGLTDQKGKESVKLFCPYCKEIYRSKSSRHENIDGAYFGTTFPHLFFLVFPELQPHHKKGRADYNISRLAGTRRDGNTKETYTPRIFGFPIHSTAHERALNAVKMLNEKRKRGKTKSSELLTTQKSLLSKP